MTHKLQQNGPHLTFVGRKIWLDPESLRLILKADSDPQILNSHFDLPLATYFPHQTLMSTHHPCFLSHAISVCYCRVGRVG